MRTLGHKRPNLRIHRVEGAEIETKGLGNLLNEISRKFPQNFKDIDTHVQEAFQTPNRHEQKRTIPYHDIIKMPKLKERY
jgi:hypothetical protein